MLSKREGERSIWPVLIIRYSNAMKTKLSNLNLKRLYILSDLHRPSGLGSNQRFAAMSAASELRITGFSFPHA